MATAVATRSEKLMVTTKDRMALAGKRLRNTTVTSMLTARPTEHISMRVKTKGPLLNKEFSVRMSLSSSRWSAILLSIPAALVARLAQVLSI